MKNEEYFGAGLSKPNSKGYTERPVSNPQAKRTVKTFEKLSKESEKVQAEVLFNIFRELHSAQSRQSSDGYKLERDVYLGTDETFKSEIKKFFGNEETIYNGVDLNSIVKSIITKVMQPFMSKDNILTVTPESMAVETADRLSYLLNSQMANEGFIEEAYKVIKDGLLHGIGFLSIGLERRTTILPKRILTRTLDQTSLSESGDFEYDITGDEMEEEEIEELIPDFRAETITNIIYPNVQRWSEVPYVIRRERITRRAMNERYSTKHDELSTEISESTYSTDLDKDLKYLPGTESTYEFDDSVEIVHFYFKDGSYYVGSLCTEKDNRKAAYGMKIVYKGTSPIPGLAIPVIPFIPEPLTGRICGESIVLTALSEQRKITELDNLMMRMVRNQASAPILYNKGSGFNEAEFKSRSPNQPIGIMGDVNTDIRKLELDKLDATIPGLKEHYYSVLQRITGQSDFAMGNIGKSARLTGVDSLIGMSMSRLSVMISQFNKFVLGTANALVLMNRAFLPESYARMVLGTHAPEQVEKLFIPYPLTVKISTAVNGSSDLSVRLGALNTAIQLGMQYEAASPGSVDVMGLLQHYFSESGIKEIGRYFLQSPMTLTERKTLAQMDSILAMQQSSLPGVPTMNSAQIGTGQTQDPGSLSMGNDIGGNGQTGVIAPLNEQSNFGL